MKRMTDDAEPAKEALCGGGGIFEEVFSPSRVHIRETAAMRNLLLLGDKRW